MEFEILNKDNRKYWILGIIVIIALSSVIFFVSTRANYKVTQKVNIANGIINYNPSDLTVVSIKVQNSSGGYDNASSVPTSGYNLSSTSYCEVNGTKDTSISMEYKDGKVYIPINTKNTKCYLYFDIKPLVKDQILANKTVTTKTDFSTVLTTNTTGKIYTAEDNDGTSYYFAGAVDNNWVKFGGFYWRIIRINGDGTIRMIYNGTTTDQTGTTTQIGTSKFNASYNDNAYVGYMYGQTGASTYNATHTNTNSSTIKQAVDAWYETNIKGKNYEQYIDTNAGFCGDRTSTTTNGAAPNETGGYKTMTSYYGGRYRLYTNKTPSLKCTNTNDLYTVSSSNKGNKALTYPIGLISADEVAYAGAVYNKNNSAYYLYTSQSYWTMSPSYLSNSYSYVFITNSYGQDSFIAVNIVSGVRPVINLRADVTLSGVGTKTSPYEVV